MIMGHQHRRGLISVIAKLQLLRRYVCFQLYTFPHPHTLLYQLVSKNWYLWTHLTFYCPGLISFTDWECFQPCNFLFLFSLTDQPGSGSDECQNVAAAEGGAAALPAPLNYLQLVVFPRKVQNLCFTVYCLLELDRCRWSLTWIWELRTLHRTDNAEDKMR